MLCELMKDLVELRCGIIAVIEYGHFELLCVLIYGFEPSGGESTINELIARLCVGLVSVRGILVNQLKLAGFEVYL